MFKDKTFKCRVCDSCGKIVEIPGVENLCSKKLYKIKNFETGCVDEVCGDCLVDRAFTCCICGDFFYNTDKFVYDVFYYCPECAKKRAKDLSKEYFDFIEKVKDWKKERSEAENNEN